MKKFLFYIMLPIMAVVFSSCSDDDDVMDTKQIKGVWQLVSQGSPDRGRIYSFATQNENTWSWGTLTTYYLTVSGNPVSDGVFDWHVSDPENYDPVYLDITPADLPGDDAWEATKQYIVEKLTASEMVLKPVTPGASDTQLIFVRRNDLQLP